MERGEEVQEIKQKIILCAIVFIFVMALGVVLVFNRFGTDVNEVLQGIRNQDNFVVFFRDDDVRCEKCSMVEERLNSLGVSYYNFDVQSSSFDDVLQRLNIDYEVKAPAVYVIENGKVRYNITNIQDEETVNSFVENNHVVSFSNQDS